jgi:hypothetical protein
VRHGSNFIPQASEDLEIQNFEAFLVLLFMTASINIENCFVSLRGVLDFNYGIAICSLLYYRDVKSPFGFQNKQINPTSTQHSQRLAKKGARIE